MLTTLHALVLGLIEGITEFLPISSTGHMILASDALRIAPSEFLKTFEIVIQLGAILAVLLLYWKKLLLNGKIFMRVAVAFLPTAVIGLVAYKFVKAHLLGNAMVVVWTLGIGGVLLIAFEFFRKGREQGASADITRELESLSYPKALLIGVFQAVAIVPGVSRSAATIVGGLALGISRQAIVEFSFMLAVPTMAAATGLDLLKSAGGFSGHETTLLVVGLIVSFLSALAAVKFLLRFVKTHNFVSFGIYRIVIAAAFLLYLV